MLAACWAEQAGRARTSFDLESEDIHWPEKTAEGLSTEKKEEGRRRIERSVRWPFLNESFFCQVLHHLFLARHLPGPARAPSSALARALPALRRGFRASSAPMQGREGRDRDHRHMSLAFRPAHLSHLTQLMLRLPGRLPLRSALRLRKRTADPTDNNINQQ